MTTDPQLYTAYAEVILRTGVNLRQGQSLMIRADPASRNFARTLAGIAWDMGAKWVEVRYEDSVLDRIRVDRSRPEHLDFVPDFIVSRSREIISDGWASIAVRGPEFPDVLEGVDPSPLGRVRKALSRAGKEFQTAIAANRIPWNVCIYPTEGWAAKVLGDDEDWEERIWEVLGPVLRLDRDDPASAWLEHDTILKKRSGFLDTERFDSFRFTGPGTDLTIGMAPGSRFAGGRCEAATGVLFFPNIPTEEVFTTPDFRRTSGRVSCTRPLYLMGALVEGAWFVFRDGAVVEFGAETGAQFIEKFLQTDEQSRYIGEMALVGTDSPIYRSGFLFHNILLDENAACHIALGNGYTDTVAGAGGKSDEELLAMGCNVSLVHTDFMIGSADVSVSGTRKDGSSVPVIVDGQFVI